jgi:hypothetical protein
MASRITPAVANQIQAAGARIGTIGQKIDTLAGDETGQGGMAYRVEGAAQAVMGFADIVVRTGVAVGAVVARKPSVAITAYQGLNETLEHIYGGVDKVWLGSDQAIADYYKSKAAYMAYFSKGLLERPDQVPIEETPPGYPSPPVPPELSADLAQLLAAVMYLGTYLSGRAGWANEGPGYFTTDVDFNSMTHRGALAQVKWDTEAAYSSAASARTAAEALEGLVTEAKTAAEVAGEKATLALATIQAAIQSLIRYPLTLQGISQYQTDVAAGRITGDGLIVLYDTQTTQGWVPSLNPTLLTLTSPSGDNTISVLRLIVDALTALSPHTGP